MSARNITGPMMRPHMLAFALCMTIAASAAAQEACRRELRGARAEFLAEVRRYSSGEAGGEAVAGSAFGLRRVAPEAVRLVTDETVCSRAGVAYCAAMGRNSETCTGAFSSWRLPIDWSSSIRSTATKGTDPVRWRPYSTPPFATSVRLAASKLGCRLTSACS